MFYYYISNSEKKYKNDLINMLRLSILMQRKELLSYFTSYEYLVLFEVTVCIKTLMTNKFTVSN